MYKKNCEFCAGSQGKAIDAKQEGPFGGNGEPLFRERAVSAGGKIIGVEI